MGIDCHCDALAMTKHVFLILYSFSRSSGCLSLYLRDGCPKAIFLCFISSELKSISGPYAFIYILQASLFLDKSLKYKHYV